MSRIYHLLGVSHPFDPSHRFTSSIILPPLILSIVRLVISLYSFVTIFIIFAWDCTHGPIADARHWFSYFTNLTYVGLAFYFLFAGLHTMIYAIRGRSWLSDWPKSLQAAHSIYYTTVVVFPPLVTIVFWAILYSDPWFPVTEEAWSNVSRVSDP